MAEKVFNPMSIMDGNYRVTRRANFTKIGTFKSSTVGSVIDFAFNMTFGSKGEHRHSRSGGTISRGNLEIFTNTFQGKLSEFAVANVLYKHKDFKEPDLSTHGLGVWEDADFQLGENAIAVKSTKSYGNLILLESKDWDLQGKYLASVTESRTYSHIVLVRIKPDAEEILRKFRSDLNNDIVLEDKEYIKNDSIKSKIFYNLSITEKKLNDGADEYFSNSNSLGEVNLWFLKFPLENSYLDSSAVHLLLL